MNNEKIGNLELNKIYCMDCLDGIKSLPDNSIDLVITDPPYNINLKPQRKKTKSIENDNMKDNDFGVFLNKIFLEINRVLKENSFLIIFTGWSTIPTFRKVLDNYFELKSMPIWVKNNFGIGYYTRPQYEPCFLYLKGKPQILDRPISDVWKFNKIQSPIHSCEKPIKLMRFILKSFGKQNQIVLDPFGGVGAVFKAAKELSMNFIGFEISEEYCKIANKRLEQETVESWFD